MDTELEPTESECRDDPARAEAASQALCISMLACDVANLRREKARLEVANAELAAQRDRAEAAADALRKALAEVDAFTHTVSHDLREPLHAITCFAEVLQQTDGGALSEKGRHRLGRIVAGSKRMACMIESLLACSRAERVRMHRHDVDLHALATAAVQDLQDEASRAHVEIAGLPVVSADGVLLRQVFANLIGNALKFSARKAAPRVRIDARIAGDVVEVRVQDNGAGFDPAYAHKLFGLFERLHPDSEFPGTGVGLTIVKRIVERHGGTVRAHCEPGGLTTFAFTLPLAAASRAETLPA